MTNPLRICDLMLRDGHQSLLATRMRTDDMLPIAEKIDQVGYWAVEMWGGATFDSAMRFLDENPWDRIRRLKEHMPNTPFMMLLRGQNVVGYRHYPDDVLDRFVVHAHKNGIDVFRIFDALNDVRNMRKAMEVVKREGAHVQASICYTIGPPYSIDYFVDVAGRLAEMGADSICIKDMAGLISPYAAFELVRRLKAGLDLPIHLHSHATSGMATTAHLKAVEAGVDIVDTTISALSLTTSHPPTESIVAMLKGRERDPGLDLDLLAEISGYFAKIRRKYASFESGMFGVDVRVLQFQIPGGMLSNLVSQLRGQGAEDKYEAVLDEVPRVRADLGYPPLVTPSSQLVGTQATLNVVLGERYKVIPEEVRQYVRGYYGRPPAPIAPQVREMAIGDEEPIDCRPADLISPGMERARGEVTEILGDLAPNEEDVISYALFPQVARPFLERRARGGNGKEPVVAAIAGLLLERATARERSEAQLQPGAASRSTTSAWRAGWRPGRGRWTGLLAGSGGGP
jgi:pyruvate/oxaloacetate carboxyltransferase